MLDLPPGADAELHANVGRILLHQGRHRDALDHLNRAIEMDPAHAVAHNNRGALLYQMGQISEALASFRTAIVQDQRLPDPYINLVKCMNYLPGAMLGLVLEASRRWADLAYPATAAPSSFANDRSPDRRLRLGYVSADLWTHSVAHFLETVLVAHDRSAVEITCYSNNALDDETTERIKATVDHWRTLTGLDSAAAAAQIRHDGIDILVDLSGHTLGDRLDVFALKPAPVQCTWLGYYATTGLRQIDYIIADRFVVAAGDERFYTEIPWRMPDSYLCFTPPAVAPPVNVLPARRNGFVTFGSCNNLLKINNLVIALWARLLHTVPRSQLLLSHTALQLARVRDEIARKFGEHGIVADRLVLKPGRPRREFIWTYHDFDIALDPFPYGGGTTTSEALWMGLPVVSLRGDRFSGRVSESILTTIGAPDLVAADEAQYLAIGAALANDLDRLEELRAGLRARVAASPLCDAPRFARNLEAAFRQMWQRWCAAEIAAA